MQQRASLKTLLGIDLRALAALRIALGALLVVDTLMRWQDLQAFYTDAGVLPIQPYRERFANPLHWSLHLLDGGPGWQTCLFTAALLAGLAVTVGYRTRLATAAGWVLLVSVQNRNPLLLNGGDVLLRLLYFWALFLPLGARRSVDAALGRARDGRPTVEPRYFGGPTVALILQVAMVYLTTAVLKTGDAWWPNGTAGYEALGLDAFTTHWGVWMKQWWTALRISTYLVLGLEAAVAPLILCPFYAVPVRLVLILGLIIMHLSFAAAMRLGIFPWVDLAALLPLVPTEAWDFLAARVAPQPGLRLAYDRDCDVCRKIVHLLREILPPGTTAVPAQDIPELAVQVAERRSWIVTCQDGTHHCKWNGVITVLEAVPLAGGICRRLPLRALRPVGDRIYDWASRHRPALGKAAAGLLPWRTSRPLRPALATNLAALFLLGVVGLCNLHTIPGSGVDLDQRLERLADILRLDQRWNMFAPFPLKEGGWYSMPGELAGGTRVDLIQGDGYPPRDAEPELVSDLYPNARWRKYMMSLYEPSRTDYRLYFGKYVCRTWNRTHPEAQRLRRFDLTFMRRLTALPGETAKVDRIVLWQHDCFGRTASGMRPGRARRRQGPS